MEAASAVSLPDIWLAAATRPAVANGGPGAASESAPAPDPRRPPLPPDLVDLTSPASPLPPGPPSEGETFFLTYDIADAWSCEASHVTMIDTPPLGSGRNSPDRDATA